MDALFLARLQFALTIGFHFIFPPLSIGMAWILVVIEWNGWRKNDPVYIRAGKFLAKLLAVNFALGVATGIVMEFQFGTNWAEYSKFVGDIFGAPLAAEGVFAFFLESGFLGLFLFGRDKVSKGLHWFASLMVAVGATISAFWIIVANSWQQTPAGFVIQNGRAELTNFWEAVFNPSTLPRYFHTVDSCLVAGAFFVAGVAAYLLLRGKQVEVAKKILMVAVVFGVISSVVAAFPTGHEHARQVAQTQPAKFAAIEGLYTSQSRAPLVLFGLPIDRPPELKAPIEIPALLSVMAFGDPHAKVRGIDEFPSNEIPPLWLTFVSFHNMVILGMGFIALMGLAFYLLVRDRLHTTKWLLKALVIAMPFPIVAIQMGWVVAEVGRQPWIVYNILRTDQANSMNLFAGDILLSVILFSLIYLFLFAVWVFVLVREINHGPEPALREEVTA